MELIKKKMLLMSALFGLIVGLLIITVRYSILYGEAQGCAKFGGVMFNESCIDAKLLKELPDMVCFKKESVPVWNTNQLPSVNFSLTNS